MRIFLAGATGAIGRPLLAKLLKQGHEVTALTRHESKAGPLRDSGATPAVADVFDRDAIVRAIVDAKPDVVLHQLTAIPKVVNPRRIARDFAETNRLRVVGTPHLVEGALEAGARRLIAQSISFAYRPGGSSIKNEDDPLYLDAFEPWKTIVSAVASLEGAVLNAGDLESVVLRYGFFYGPGTSYARDGQLASEAKKRRVPIVGDGGGVFSFIHVDDAAGATLAAMDDAPPGIYNVVDDEPAPARDWIPAYSAAVGAPRPWRVPKWLGRLAAGRYGIHFMTEQAGASNEKIKRATKWVPRPSSWREGFRSSL